MLRDEIAPALRQLGLKGSGQSYTVPSDTHWGVIGFQKFTWSSADCVEFTINLIVASKDEWAEAYESRPYIGQRPKPNVLAAVGWCTRIGGLFPGRVERKWAVAANGKTEDVAEQVVAVIRDHALPAMRERMS